MLYDGDANEGATPHCMVGGGFPVDNPLQLINWHSGAMDHQYQMDDPSVGKY